jgi:hypothetical protein
MIVDRKNKRSNTVKKVKVEARLDPSVKELLELMLSKTTLTKSELFEEFAARWIAANFEHLLSDEEKKPFLNLFFNQTQPTMATV